MARLRRAFFGEHPEYTRSEHTMSQIEALSRRCGSRANPSKTWSPCRGEGAQEDNPKGVESWESNFWDLTPAMVGQSSSLWERPQFPFKVSSESISFAMKSHILGSFSIW